MNLNKLLSPESVAVIGASERYESPGSVVILNMLGRNFSGSIYPINPKYDTIHGLPAFKSFHDLPETPDCVLICVNARMVVPILREVAEGGAGAAVIYASGFQETGEDGKQLQAEIKKISETYNMPFCGPNCIGPVNFLNGFGGFSANLPEPYFPGNVSAVCQSGSVAIALLNSGRGIHFRYLVSSGNEASVTVEDYFDYLLDDDGTEVVLGFVESFKNIPKLQQVAARARKMKKTIALVKVGRTPFAQRTVLSHTGALAGEDVVINTMLSKIGIIRVQDLNELLETAELFRRLSPPVGSRVGMVAISGGEIGLLSDLCADIGIQLPELGEDTKEKLRAILPPYSPIANPVDAWGNGDLGETFQKCIEATGADSAYDAIVVCLDVQSGMSDKQANYYAMAARSIVEAGNHIKKPLVVLSNLGSGVHPKIAEILNRASIPVLQGTASGLRAIHHWVSYHYFRSWADVTLTRRSNVSQLPDFSDNGILTEHAAGNLLRELGIPVNPCVLALSIEEALNVADAIGYPVVLKVDSPDILHRQAAGVVALHVRDNSELEEKYLHILDKAKSAFPQATIHGVTIQKMIDTSLAVEMIAGFSIDPQCGPVILLGMGGVYAELLDDTSLRLASLTPEDALQMITELRGAPLLASSDQAALANVLVKLSDFAMAYQNEIAQLDINPLLVFPEGQGVLAVDALATAREGKAE
jgi:acetate---CoA ligase (ADP-forming)